jgi:hypothetical protein
MNLKHLTDETLHSDTHRLNREHNEVLTKLLHHLQENERRRLFSKYKYASLFSYVVGELKYSEDEANRRISAMRLLRDIPQIENKITSGELSLTNLVLAQTLFSKERKLGRAYTAFQKAEVLLKLENQSVRAAQKIVAEINPEMKTKKTELNFDSIMDESLKEKLLKIKGDYAHSDPNLTLNELLHKLCDLQIEAKQKTPAKKKSPAAAHVTSQAAIRRQVWKRDQHRCTNCKSTHAVQIDHRIPKAMGERSTLENMRLLCRSCNQRAAIEFFGIGKMEPYLLV